MRKKISNHLSKNWYHWILVCMIVINSIEIYQQWNSEKFADVLTNNLILSIWVFNWYILMRLNKIKEQEAELWREECQRLYKIIDEQNKRDLTLLKLLKSLT